MFGKISFPAKKDKANVPAPSKHPTQTKTKIIIKKPKTSPGPSKKIVHVQQSLKGSKFRMLNELLYTTPSHEAASYFKQHQEDFQIYHEGFREQADKWSQNPLHTIIAYLKKHYASKSKLILDLGCGEAELQEKMQPQTSVRSFDLVAKKPFVEIADIAHLPVESGSADACVFCLSLMGTNYLDFIQEAKRVLHNNGELLIAEVESRCKDWPSFIKMVESLGFSCKANKTNKYFRILYFNADENNIRKLKLNGEVHEIKQFSQSILTSCLYKKR